MSFHDLVRLGCVVRPLRKVWPQPRHEGPPGTTFRAPMQSTAKLLAAELRALDAEDGSIVLELDVPRDRIRIDGMPYANASTDRPDVILTFRGRHGPLEFACDAFPTWQDNLRAIALTMQALRAVDRYGAASAGQQYRGWDALPPAGGSTVTMTTEEAVHVLARESGRRLTDGMVAGALGDPERLHRWYRQAVAAVHPDRLGHESSRWHDVQEAKRVVESHLGGPL